MAQAAMARGSIKAESRSVGSSISGTEKQPSCSNLEGCHTATAGELELEWAWPAQNTGPLC